MKNEIHISGNEGLKEFLKLRVPGEVNLVEIVSSHMASVLSPTHAKVFEEDPLIKSISASNMGVQRVIINRYLSRLLLVFKTKRPKVKINATLMYLFNDGYVEDWVKIYKEIILKFLKNKEVYETLKLVDTTNKEK